MTAALVILTLAVVAAWLTYANSDTAQRRSVHRSMERAHRREDAAMRRLLDGPKR